MYFKVSIRALRYSSRALPHGLSTWIIIAHSRTEVCGLKEEGYKGDEAEEEHREAYVKVVEVGPSSKRHIYVEPGVLHALVIPLRPRHALLDANL